MTADVSIVIRCRDEARHLGAVLDAVFAQRAAPAFEVLALDSGSRDGTIELLSRYPVRIERLESASWTYGRALNVGAARARAAVVVYLSAHCRPLSTSWLARLVAPFADPAVIATFGRQVPVPGVNPIEAITTARNFPAEEPAAVLFSTANGAARRDAILARPFDDEIAIAEDHLWARAIGPTSRIAYVPDAVVAHSHPMGFEHWRSRFYAHGLASEYVRVRHGEALPWGNGDAGAGRIIRTRAAAFIALAIRLVRERELRGLTQLPAYALARTLAYARGVRDGALRYGPRP